MRREDGTTLEPVLPPVHEEPVPVVTSAIPVITDPATGRSD